LPPAGAIYDDHWVGGWDELFPNDAPGLVDGRQLPDHGDWWNLRWRSAEVRLGGQLVGVEMVASGRCVRAEYSKIVVLHPELPVVTVKYTIVNREERPLPFLLKLHPAMAVRAGDRILVSPGSVRRVDGTFSTIISTDSTSRWPWGVGELGSVDLSVVPQQSTHLREFVYVTDVHEGWCGVESEDGSERFRLDFPVAVFPHVWLFMAYGGWRDCYTVVLEPCTAYPKDLHVALAEGRCRMLLPGERLECEVVATLDMTE
jgi:hypothetical protein